MFNAPTMQLFKRWVRLIRNGEVAARLTLV